MMLPSRHGSLDSYRYGFQGQERDDEIKGEGNSINYTFRMHDPRVGRFFAVDPLEKQFAWFSPYQFSGNRVLDRIELEGAETALPPYLWSSYATATYTYGEDGHYQTAYLIEGKWHVQQSYSKSLYHNGNEWVSNFNHTTNDEFIRAYGYQYTKEELKIIDDSGLNNTGSHKHAPFSRWWKSHPTPITEETIRMYGNAFQIDMDYLIALQWWDVAVTGGTIAGEASFFMSGKLPRASQYNYKGGLAPKNAKVYLYSKSTRIVEEHLQQFGRKAENDVMIRRMKQIDNGEIEATEIDIAFKNHEILEANYMSKGMTYEEAHIQTLKDQNMYHRDYEKKLYTQEALDAGNEQLIKEAENGG